jgi:uroporphyrinogen III methyltransferase/synthase
VTLSGRRVVVTRASRSAAVLTRILRARGAVVTDAPVIEIRPLRPSQKHLGWLRELSSYDGLLFTSANAVARTAAVLRKKALPVGMKIFAVGPKTAARITAEHWPAPVTAKDFSAEGLARRMRDVSQKKFLFPRALEGRDVLVDALTRRGARVDLWPVYETTFHRPSAVVRRALTSGRTDAVTFASGSAATSLLGRMSAKEKARLFSRAVAVSIGPVTSAALRAQGVRRIVESRRATLEDMADTLERSFPS